MPETNSKVNTLLSRTNLRLPFNYFLREIEFNFPVIGKIQYVNPINQGYEDANFKLTTHLGKFVLKIFSKDRTSANVNAYVRVLEESYKNGVPVTELVGGKHGTDGKSGDTKYIVTKFFRGKDFQKVTPTIEDIKEVTGYIAKLNTLNFSIEESYDSWGNKNLYKEYEKHNNKLSVEHKEIIKPIIRDFVKINLSKLAKSVIHGDMQRKHVLKNKGGKYCILDFGCVAYGPKIIDLSTYLAWFCLQKDTWVHRKEIYNLVLCEYTKIHKLSGDEINRLPVLIRASYAAYFMKTSILRAEGDNSAETFEWNKLSKEMLELSNGWY